MRTNAKIGSGQEVYNTVASYLIKFAKDINTAEEAYEKHGKRIESLVGFIFAPAVDMMIRVYYNVEDFVADGEPMDQVWRDIEDMCNQPKKKF
jgi:hypothetical protein